MAFFLLLYIVGALIWAVWTGILVFHAVKFKFPDDKSNLYLLIFAATCAVILLFSIMFIARADWMTVPKFLGGV